MGSCERCPVSLICLMGKLDIKLYCAVCERLELFPLVLREEPYTVAAEPQFIPCPRDRANELGATLSVCTTCQQEQRDKRNEEIRKCLRRRHGTTDQSRRNRRDDRPGRG